MGFRAEGILKWGTVVNASPAQIEFLTKKPKWEGTLWNPPTGPIPAAMSDFDNSVPGAATKVGSPVAP